MRFLLTFPIILLLNLFLSSTVDAQRTNALDPFTGLDTAFARVLKDWHAAGFAVAVVRKDKVIYAKGFGFRDWQKKLPVTPQTLFAIGSCTKAFTASLLGILQDQHLLDIDKPVRDYLPELRFYNNTMDNTITLRDMMTHRTGLTRYDYAWYLFSDTRDSILRKIRYMEPTATLREKWQYNNFMFLAQGMVAAKLTGKSWENNISEKIFQPLGMTTSSFSIKDLQASADASLGYDVKKDSLIHLLDYHDVDPIAPAGSINSNVLDMSAWLTTWINGGKFHGKQILPAGYISDATSAQMAMGGGLPSKEDPSIYFATYGLGWMLSSYRGHYRVEHGGNIDGFSASTCFFPTDSIGIVVLTNQNNSTVTSIVRNLLTDRLLHLEYKDWNTYIRSLVKSGNAEAKAAQAAKVDESGSVHPLSHALSAYTGVYSNPAYGAFELKIIHDSLLAFFPHRTWYLKPWNYDVFQAFDGVPRDGYDTAGGVGLKVKFNMDVLGNIDALAMDLEYNKTTTFTRQPSVKHLDSLALTKYTGEYQLGPQMIVTVYIKEGKTLILSVPGQTDYVLVPSDEGKFSISGLNGFIEQFNTDEQGKVTEILSIQPNGTFKGKKIK